MANCQYRQTSNIRHTLVGNEIVDHSDVVGAAPTGDAPTTSEWSTILLPDIRHTLAGNKMVDCSDFVGALPVGAAPTISSFST